MTHHSPNVEAGRLLQLSEEVGRIAGSLAKISLGLEDQAPRVSIPACGEPEILGQSVRWLINARSRRLQFLPSDLFADPAWDILLELYRAEIANQRISVSSLCIAANVPATTALRYIKSMVQQGMIVREADRFDGRRVYVALTPEISKALCSYFVNVIQEPLARKKTSSGSHGTYAVD